ncbi:alpha/beta fold hydrolase [Maritimibacter sp. UBA3975]|uniref:alpha/beta fold hydrolase n=1 Tax=Maritimibacter sp. UBA3975 TaxID=1946833 RepID=UPI000C0B9E0B|nr:alpha/beta fold hydrolase [Maritimibacter sp. UBA3975]MAM62318.1 esterase [Maritimibacter sp.]|tara:strand:+ start:5345 stop:6058 length:714 start_codon:yes stop_codon:yes gene_type:complete
MAQFLLIHGSNHGAWCWRDVIPELERLGHTARALDLPSHGDDPTPIADVTLDSYADAILGALDGPTILVGHSAGGFAITQAAERDPRNVAGLVFVTAYVPQPGKSLVDMLGEAPEQPMKGAFEMAPDKLSFRFKPEFLTSALYGDCPEGTYDYAMAHIGWQPLATQTTPATLTGASDNVPRHYVFCTEDRAVPPAHQRQMAAGFAPENTVELATGHSPFFSAPRALAEALDGFSDAM